MTTKLKRTTGSRSMQRLVRFPGLTLTGKEIVTLVKTLERLSRHVRVGRGYCVMEEVGGYKLFKKLKKHLGQEI